MPWLGNGGGPARSSWHSGRRTFPGGEVEVLTRPAHGVAIGTCFRGLATQRDASRARVGAGVLPEEALEDLARLGLCAAGLPRPQPRGAVDVVEGAESADGTGAAGTAGDVAACLAMAARSRIVAMRVTTSQSTMRISALTQACIDVI